MNTGLNSFPRRSAFTLLEVMIVGLLLSMLALFLSGMWSAFGPAVADITRSARYAQDLQLAVESLRRDLSGSLVDLKTGSIQRGQLVGWFEHGQDELHLCFDGEPTDGAAAWAAPDIVVRYRVEGGQLVRWDSQTSQSMIVASHVRQLDIGAYETRVDVKLEFAFPYYEPKTGTMELDIRTLQFAAHKPLRRFGES
jgi:type II secretory pathway pseudopilin PulG